MSTRKEQSTKRQRKVEQPAQSAQTPVITPEMFKTLMDRHDDVLKRLAQLDSTREQAAQSDTAQNGLQTRQDAPGTPQTAATAAATMVPTVPLKSRPSAPRVYQRTPRPLKTANSSRWQPLEHYERELVTLLTQAFGDPYATPRITTENGQLTAFFADGARIKILFDGPVLRNRVSRYRRRQSTS